MIAGWLSILVGSLLLSVKFFAYSMTQSQSVFSDAMESIINVVAAAIALVMISWAAKPADRDHPYGHGKAEYFSAAFEGGLITIAAIWISIEAIGALVRGHEPRQLDLGLLIVLGAGIVNALLGFYLKHMGRRYHSPILIASGQHVLTDFWTSLGVVIGLAAVQLTGIFWLDPCVALLVAVHLAYTGSKVVRESSGGLMDAEDRDLIERLTKLFAKHTFPGIIRFHYTRVIRSGRFHHIDSHVVVPEFWDVKKAHDETDRFESLVIGDHFTDGEIAFHVDPCMRAYCSVCDLPECEVRQQPFERRVPFTLEELTSPNELPRFKRSGGG